MSFEPSDGLTREELAWNLAELFHDLKVEQINEVLAKNVPLETLEFFSAYAEDFCNANSVDGETRERMPNLLVLGYLLRILEERLLGSGDSYDA